METTITESSGNVFADLGFEPPEAAILEMRASLMSDLRTYIQASGMTQAEAAEKLRIAQSRVSDLMRGKWEKYTRNVDYPGGPRRTKGNFRTGSVNAFCAAGEYAAQWQRFHNWLLEPGLK